ncbi:MAG: cytochrome c oxidase subunit II, partial [Bacteroidota bacterium]
MSQIYEAIRSFWLPEQASTTAHVIDAPFMFILITSTIMLIGVTAYLFYLPWKYRRRSASDVPYPVKENHLLELSWIVIPTILVFIVFFWGFKAHVDTVVAPTDAYEVNVQGKKWLWQFNYDHGKTTTNELYVPANRPVKLIMNSVDVLHSFYVPEFRIKHDVLPNRYSTVWFEAVRADTFQILCTEYCGTGHSVMGAKVIALG